MYYIISIKDKCPFTGEDKKKYLAWRNPAWDEDGYFYTSLDTVIEMLSKIVLDDKHPYVYMKRPMNYSQTQPFLFKTVEDSKKFLRNKEWGKNNDFIIEKLP